MEIGEYIRTKKGLIGMVIKIREGKCINKYINYLIDWGNGKATYRTAIKDMKHSKNIIDLIEVGDYVNGDEVIAIDYNEDENGNAFNVLGVYDIDDDYAYTIDLNRIHIKTILTKEQYEQNSYKI